MITTSRMYICPECQKRRIVRENQYDDAGIFIPWTPSGDMIEKDISTGEKIKHRAFDDICSACQKKIFNKYYKPTKVDAQKVLKAVQDGSNLKGESLEDLL